MYNGNSLVGTQEMATKQAYIDERPKTMRENIDRQIAQAEAHVTRLRDLKSKLEAGTSLLDLDMNDLRQGMNY